MVNKYEIENKSNKKEVKIVVTKKMNGYENIRWDPCDRPIEDEYTEFTLIDTPETERLKEMIKKECGMTICNDFAHKLIYGETMDRPIYIVRSPA